MSAAREVNKGTVGILPFIVRDTSRNAVDADALPTVDQVFVNGVFTNMAGITVEQLQDSTPANVTGYYQIKLPTTNLDVGDQIQLTFSAVIAGVTKSENMLVLVVNNPDQTPSIEVI